MPSFDQPDMKAVWEIAAVVPHDRSAVSNMPDSRRRSNRSELKRVRFAPRRRCRPIFCSSAWATSSGSPQGRRRGVGVVAKRGDAENGRFALDAAAQLLALLQRLLRRPLPAAEARSGRGARQRRFRRHGELGRDPLFRGRPADRSEAVDREPTAGRLHRRRARDRAPVVRRPRDMALVGRPLAERGLRLVDGAQGDGSLSSRLEHRGCGPAATRTAMGLDRSRDEASRVPADRTTGQADAPSTRSPTRKDTPSFG